MTLAPVPDDVLAIVRQTFLANLNASLVTEILAGGRRVDLARGGMLTASANHPKKPRDRDARPGLSIVVDGLVRVFLKSQERDQDRPPRQVTVRYARPGETLGLVHLLRAKLDVHAQAVTDTSLWVISAKRLRLLAEESAPLAMAIAEDCAMRVADAVEELAYTTFGSVRQRVARHLLDLAAAEGHDGELVAQVTPKALADATGSVREVIARVLKDLNATGVTGKSSHGITIKDATRLDEEARGQSHDLP